MQRIAYTVAGGSTMLWRRKKKHDKRESGEPGGGAGRRDEGVGGSGVYPGTGAEHPRDAEVRQPGEWGQKLGGEVGGRSELNPYEMGLTDRDLERVNKDAETETTRRNRKR
jgi:hypothetical protein